MVWRLLLFQQDLLPALELISTTTRTQAPARLSTECKSPCLTTKYASVYGELVITFHQACNARSRNKGLFTANQVLNNNNGALATRQNPGGARYGFECNEEKDYYPYWHPSSWKDVAVFVNDLSRCSTKNSNFFIAVLFFIFYRLLPNQQPKYSQQVYLCW